MKINKINVIYAISTFCLFFYAATSCSINQDFQVTNIETQRLKNRGYMATEDEVKDGYKLYVSRCGSCHNLIAPSKYTLSQWQLTYLPAEFVKATVEKENEKKLISYFIYSKAR